MWLFIDTSERGRMRLASFTGHGRIQNSNRRVRHGASVVTLSKFIKPTEVNDLDGVCVVAGPGSFSAVRSGVLVANLLSRLHQLPLYGVSKEEARDLRDVRNRLVAGSIESVPYVAPVYDAEPNITCP